MTPRPTPKSHARAPVTFATPLVWQIVQRALEYELAGTPADAALKKALSKGSRLQPVELRAAVGEIDAVNRHRARLTWALAQEQAASNSQNLLFAWRAIGIRQTPEQVRKILQGALMRDDASLIARLGRYTFDDKRMPEAVRLECPPMFEGALRQALGGRFAAEMRAGIERAPVDLRINTLKATVDDCARLLKKERVETVPMRWSPWGLRYRGEANLSSTRAFENGLFEFQDEGSQLVALLADARAEHQVLDYCAGAGGKTLALGAAMQNKGHLVAADVNDDRLARAKQRLKRAGVENAERRVIETDWAKKYRGRFDRVLVDAPCSGTGSWRRNPDARWSPSAAKLTELAALQDDILDRAARFVKTGGRLVYATCSLLPVENDERIETFLARNPEFERINARDVWATVTKAEWPGDDRKVLRLSPARHGTDGFFAAVLTRAKQS
ncbi:MAG: methyltransferase domain-containing protein [Alphaproteobacteria bacterium]|nr:methyltransferase domain-containing protein [Alphaproteobacteria bacterium]